MLLHKIPKGRGSQTGMTRRDIVENVGIVVSFPFLIFIHLISLDEWC